MNAQAVRKNRPLYFNEDGNINFRSLRRGWNDTRSVNGFTVYLGFNTQGYFVHVDGKNRKTFNTLALAREAFDRTFKALAGL